MLSEKEQRFYNKIVNQLVFEDDESVDTLLEEKREAVRIANLLRQTKCICKITEVSPNFLLTVTKPKLL